MGIFCEEVGLSYKYNSEFHSSSSTQQKYYLYTESG